MTEGYRAATVFEGILFGFALWKSIQTTAERMNTGGSIRHSIMTIVTRDNILYFFGYVLALLRRRQMVALTVLPGLVFC